MTEALALRRAALWMIGAIVSFSAMAVAGRAVAFELDTFELMTYRSLIGVLLVVSVSWATGAAGQIRAQRMGLHLVRNVFHFGGQNLWFYAITVIPLAQVFALEFTSPIWVALGAPLVLAERLTRTRLISALIGFVGILVVARPDTAALGPGQLAAAGAAIGFAGSALFTRRLTRTESIVSILFWLTVLQAGFGLICAGIDGDFAIPSAVSWPWLVLIGCAGLSAHLCLTTALSLAPASVVMPIDFMRLPVIALIGMAFYGESLNAWVLLGGAIIFAANWLNIRRANRTVT
ncbi:DMT family transporter [Palleronia abyssalis]|uniref:Riboflavin transporter n=1 Tax=Palleronia abyssalis TaxID=1501240 RepID=A0A2R8BQI5_9RHOB|nr:DMT family transporter [Palleronia abyssalis]SPJ22346.1 Riboflavin transporter [Palleronia abyssalis]